MPVIEGSSSCYRSQRRESRHELNKRELNTKIHLAVDAHGMLVGVFITQGTTADCTQAGRLIERIDADYLLADRGYDSNAILLSKQENRGSKQLSLQRKLSSVEDVSIAQIVKQL